MCYDKLTANLAYGICFTFTLTFTFSLVFALCSFVYNYQIILRRIISAYTICMHVSTYVCVCVHHIPHQLSNDLTLIDQLECCVSLFLIFLFFVENIHEYIMYVLCTFLLCVCVCVFSNETFAICILLNLNFIFSLENICKNTLIKF